MFIFLSNGVLKGKMKGYRFHPTDEELIDYFLYHKNLGHEDLVEEAINEINICRFDPWDLPGQSKVKSDDQVWYFFSPRSNKYSKSKRANRKTENGYWKATGRDRKIKGKNQEVIGTKKTLVFYEGRVPNGVRTAWVVHEYRTSSVPSENGAYVICKLKYKSNGKKSISSSGGAESSHPLPPSPVDHVGTEVTSEASIQAEETPSESVCAVGGLDGDWCLLGNELDESISPLDLMFPIDFSINDDLPLFQFCSSLEDLEVENGPETQFGNSLLADRVDSSCENIRTVLHSQMQSESVAELCADSSSNIDAETAFSWISQCSPMASLGECSFNNT